MFRPGEVILAQVQFANSYEIKTRPAVVLFEEFGNIVIAGITSNLKMNGIPLTKKDGAVKACVIKPNYIFTISKMMVKKKLFDLLPQKKTELYNQLIGRLEGLRQAAAL